VKAHLVLAGLLLLAPGCGGDAEPTPTEPPAPTRVPNPITLDDWANTRGQPELTGRAGGEVSDALHLRWTFPTEAGSISSPVIARTSAIPCAPMSIIAPP